MGGMSLGTRLTGAFVIVGLVGAVVGLIGYRGIGLLARSNGSLAKRSGTPAPLASASDHQCAPAGSGRSPARSSGRRN